MLVAIPSFLLTHNPCHACCYGGGYPFANEVSNLSKVPQLTAGVVFSEIYQVTGPVERFASNIASEGYVVALPSSFHEFEGPEPIPYDTEGTDRGNKYKVCFVSTPMS